MSAAPEFEVRPPSGGESLTACTQNELDGESQLEGLRLEGLTWTTPAGRRASITSCLLDGTRLRGARLGSAADSRIERCDCANADWSGASLRRVSMHECGCTGLTLADASISDASLVGCKLNLACLIGARLSRVRFERCDLREADFDRATLEGVVFRSCDLRGARLLRTLLGAVDLRGSRLDDLAVSPDRVAGCTIDPAQADVFAAAMGLRVLPLDEATGPSA